MNVLVACEFSGVVRNAFAANGHHAVSCDLEPSEYFVRRYAGIDEPNKCTHYQGDVLDILYDGWDMMICFPPCTHLAASGRKWFKYKEKEQQAAIEFVVTLIGAPIYRKCLENPVGVLSTHIGRPTQIIQPWMFGHPYTKTTCLWLWNLDPLVPTKIVAPAEKYAHTATRDPRERSRTFQGVADAMATQWNYKD